MFLPLLTLFLGHRKDSGQDRRTPTTSCLYSPCCHCALPLLTSYFHLCRTPPQMSVFKVLLFLHFPLNLSSSLLYLPYLPLRKRREVLFARHPLTSSLSASCLMLCLLSSLFFSATSQDFASSLSGRVKKIPVIPGVVFAFALRYQHCCTWSPSVCLRKERREEPTGHARTQHGPR